MAIRVAIPGAYIDLRAVNRRLLVRTDTGSEQYPILHVERTSVPDTYRLHIDSSAGAWLPAGTYEATIHGKQRVSGSLAVIDYLVTDEGILFVGLFRIVRAVTASQHG